MFVTSIVASLLMAQGATDPQVAESDAGYELIADRQVAEAIAHLEKLHAANPDDPAVLINLASAYIDAGMLVEAREAYRLAMQSDDRVQLELADGSWSDSRHLARLGLARLEQSRAWAMR